MARIKNVLLGLVVLIVLVGCGKYSSPRPPEEFAPAQVQNLIVTPGYQGVLFAWESPKDTAMGKELKQIDGYRVYRRELAADSRLVDPTAKFDLLAEISDTHLAELNELKQKAIEQGQLSRKVSLPKERSQFQYQDRGVSVGKSYYYEIVPVNQGGIEGVVGERIKIDFKGDLSQISRIPYSAEEFEF